LILTAGGQLGKTGEGDEGIWSVLPVATTEIFAERWSFENCSAEVCNLATFIAEFRYVTKLA
jgi:hypothetical protein